MKSKLCFLLALLMLASTGCGEAASSGSDTTADIDSIATRATRDIEPLPVAIFIVEVFY